MDLPHNLISTKLNQVCKLTKSLYELKQVNSSKKNYMDLPPSLISPKSNQVYKPTKSLYELKRANREWLDKLSTSLSFH